MNDVTGRSQFTRNVVVTWIAHLFIMIAGFVLPRQINDNLGAEALGIWDLGWATVRYMSLTNLGFTSALTRYVALYNARSNQDALSRTTTAVVGWQLAIAVLVVVLTGIFSYLVIYWVDLPDTNQQHTARMVILLLGLSLAVKMITAPAGGIITGCHRWDIQNSISATQDFVMAAIMISVMLLGGQLTDLAWVAISVAIVTEITRVIIARRLVPDLKINLKHWNYKIAYKMLRFGGKSVIMSFPNVLVFQTGSILLAGFAGPASLAVYNRGIALVRHCQVIVKKMTMMFTPMTSGLLGLQQVEDAEKQLIKAGCYSFCVTFPILLGLFWYGDLFLLLWMGEGFDNRTMVLFLVAGAVLPIAQSGTTSVLAGLNAHGKVAIYSLISSVLSLILSSIVVTYWVGWSATSAAAVTGIAWSAGRGLTIQYFLRKLFKIQFFTYWWGAFIYPLICNIPLIILLGLGRHTILNGDWVLTLSLWLLGILITLAIYWIFILETNQKFIILNKLRRQ